MTVKRLKSFVAYASLGLLTGLNISACGIFGDPPPNSGYVTSKRYTAEYYEDYTTMDCYSYDSRMQCTMPVYSHHHDYHGPSWVLCLRNEDEPKNIKTGCISVNESTYNKYEQGSHYPDPR